MARRVIKYQAKDGRLFDSMVDAEEWEKPLAQTEGKQLFQIGFEFSASKSHQVEVVDRDEAQALVDGLNSSEYTKTDGIQVIGKPLPFVNILRR